MQILALLSGVLAGIPVGPVPARLARLARRVEDSFASRAMADYVAIAVDGSDGGRGGAGFVGPDLSLDLGTVRGGDLVNEGAPGGTTFVESGLTTPGEEEVEVATFFGCKTAILVGGCPEPGLLVYAES